MLIFLFACCLGPATAEVVTVDLSYEYEENKTFYWFPRQSIRRFPEDDNGQNNQHDYW